MFRRQDLEMFVQNLATESIVFVEMNDNIFTIFGCVKELFLFGYLFVLAMTIGQPFLFKTEKPLGLWSSP
jgi:hypothetical protein